MVFRVIGIKLLSNHDCYIEGHREVKGLNILQSFHLNSTKIPLFN